MPSNSLQQWQQFRRVKLDEIVEAHRAVGGIGRGRRYATEQVNHAYAVLLSSQFQGFCRDLHSECAQKIVESVPPPLRNVLRGEFLFRRALDRGNPNPGNIGGDFGRLGLRIWDRVKELDTRNDARRELLAELNDWRNAIAHQDFDPVRLGAGATLRLSEVNAWRRACSQLAQAFDEVARTHLRSLLGSFPW
jgi:hypothetical protein